MDDDDLLELKALFLDECSENIELLERGLMRMGEGGGDADTLNDVFRAAHSIKGGAATFGYLPMSELTHHMETLLEEMRSGRRGVADADVDLLLRSLDAVRDILQATRDGAADDSPERGPLQVALQAAVEAGAAPSSVGDAAPAAPAPNPDATPDATPDAHAPPSSAAPWRVRFAPGRELVRRGNEPLLLLRELARTGETRLTLDPAALPGWDDYDVGACYLAWDAQVSGEVAEADIAEIFEWVEGECTLSIERCAPAAAATLTGPDVLDIDGPDIDGPPEASDIDATPSDGALPDGGGAEPPAPPVGPVAADAAAEPAAPERRSAPRAASAETSSIRIATDKIDQLINLVGELVITQSMLGRLGNQVGTRVDLDELRERLADLEHNTRDLQESVMQVRMLPLSSAFSRLPRLVRDLSRRLDKRVDLVLEGGTTELDKTVLERMIDPLVHLVRNGLDHGLETPEARRAAGKPETGRLELNARQESGSVVIEIIDDGKGIDSATILRKAREKGIVGADEELTEEQAQQLIFAPGFSTAEQISDVSGRGVGMDVVRSNIVDLKGRVNVRSTLGVGTTIRIELPLSLAILDGQLVRVGSELYVVPILSIVETLESGQTALSTLPGGAELCRFRDVWLPMIRLDDHLGTKERSSGNLIVIVDTPGQRTGLVVDEVVGQQQVVVKPLERNYRPVPGLAGATIMSDGSVSLILDPASLADDHLHGLGRAA